MRVSIRLAAVAVLVFTLTSCGRMPPIGTADPAEQTILVVDNQSTLQVTVYVLRDSQRQRIGIANALTSTRLRIPDNLVFGPTSLRFEVHPLGSRAEPRSEQITVTPGTEVRLIIPPSLR